MFLRTRDFQTSDHQINCCIKVAQDGQRCQYAFAPRLLVGLTNSGAERPELFAGSSQPDDFA
jgi:hypothetical protein